MKLKPLVSIIIPAYNRAALLGETLDSICAQTFRNWECFIIDDGSRDHTRELCEFYIKKDYRFKYILRPERLSKGANSCRNLGFEMSRGDYIQWFDSDDLMLPNLIEKKIDYLERHPNVDFCLSPMHAFKTVNRAREIIRTTAISYNNLFEDYLLGKFSAGTPSILWRRKTIEQQENLFDPCVSHSQDLEFYSRIFKYNNKVGIVPEPLILFRTHDSSVSGEFLALKDEHLDSFLEVRRRILSLAPKNLEINKRVIFNVLDVFRSCLTSQDYTGSEKCLDFVRKNNKNRTMVFRLGFLRIQFFYRIFKMTGRGDTRFRRLLKIK